MHDRFVAAIKTFAAEHAVPLIAFESGQDKDAIVATHRARSAVGDGVVVIGVAQEEARAFKAHNGPARRGRDVRFRAASRWAVNALDIGEVTSALPSVDRAISLSASSKVSTRTTRQRGTEGRPSCKSHGDMELRVCGGRRTLGNPAPTM